MSDTKKEAKRHHLRQKAIEAMDEEAAAELMESLPPFDWHDLATKADLAAMEDRQEDRLEQLRDQLRAEHEGVRGEVHTGLAGVRGDMDAGLAITQFAA